MAGQCGGAGWPGIVGREYPRRMGDEQRHSPSGEQELRLRPDPDETSRIEKVPEGKLPVGSRGRDGNAMGSTGPASPPSSDEAVQEAAKGASNIDTIVGRLAVEQGLATPEEVQHCLELARQMGEEASQRSLADLLVSNEYITRRQMSRLRDMAQAERTGQKIPGYRILGKLGAGAMATVFKAKQLSLDRIVAIKVLPRKFTTNPQFVERFYAEGRAAAQLNHPNIVQAYDVGKAGDYHYFVMEYVDGTTVYDEIVKNKRFGEKDAIDIVLQVAEALQHAHQRGIIHRDVKPKNIMLTRNGVAKLADMGLARAMSDREAAEAEQGKAFGTPYYISPEQIRGELNIGAQADIYSLGATLYHMVTGTVPYDGKNPSAVMHKHLKAELVPPDHVNPKLSSGLSEVIEMMMAKDPRSRYQTCADLIRDLRLVREGQSPLLAHKEIGTAEMGQVLAAEAAASAEMPTAPESAAVRPWLFILLCVLLGLSVLLNVILATMVGE
jgi:tRNA A-37 threonylcarbamoyl transferase component Bud32